MRPKTLFKPFIKWHHHEVQSLLGYRYVENLPELRRWIDCPPAPMRYPELVEELRAELLFSHADWNETELGFQFIGPLLKLVRFQNTGYNSFQERLLKAQIGEWRVEGLVDWMTAAGSFRPEVPYFFLHEYKKTKAAQADPLGQLLVAMIAAQHLNADGQALYGCYVTGKYWSFVYLDGKEYSLTQGYDATDEGELKIVWSMLVEVKRIVEERVERLTGGAS